MKNEFKVTGIVTELSIIKTINNIKDDSDLNEINIKIKFDNDDEMILSEFHIWDNYERNDNEYYLNLINKHVELIGYINIYTGHKHEISLEVTNISLL